MVRTFLISSLAVLLVAGCSRGTKPPVVAGPTSTAPHDKVEHEHAKGTKALGNYHARLLVEQGGVFKLLILDKDETKIARIERQDITAQVRAADAAEHVPATLKADPQEGDPSGMTSQFVGSVPEALRGQALFVGIRLRIGGEPYFVEFETVPGAGHAANGHAGMPKGVERGGGSITEEERQLYLTPGGLYTAADIQANGNTIPRKKFKGAIWPHDQDLKVGDPLCPVTNQKAEPKCNWIVNGKKYEFCCDPCVAKFIRWAKTQPDMIKPPEEYVFK